MNVLRRMLKNSSFILFALVLAGSILLATQAYQLVVLPQVATQVFTPIPLQSLAATPILLPTQSPAKILGIEAKPDVSYPGVYWIRLAYPNCGWGNLYGDVLKSTIQSYHSQSIRVLLTICQNSHDTQSFADAARGHPDAVQCGNEQMKNDPSVAFLYIPPENFASFYDACEHAIHAVRPDIPVLLGSLDPHVYGVDDQLLLGQVSYLNKMQVAMNTVVHPKGHWDWHTQTLGLIDSWHNGWGNGSPDSTVNNLYHLFIFWAQQFHTNLEDGTLGKHLWVVEGTGCFKDCGVDANNTYQVAASHTLALITDVEAAMKYHVPFFYFSGKDFNSAGYNWPIGVLDSDGHPKAIRQDLPIGARKLVLSCSNGSVTVVDQEQLLASLYSGCTLPSNYTAVIAD